MKRWSLIALALCAMLCMVAPGSVLAQDAAPATDMTPGISAQDVPAGDEEGDAWLSFARLEGVEYIHLGEDTLPTAPEGLEGMYAWMLEGNPSADQWIARMPHGRVLISASRSEIGPAITAEELKALWPEVALKLKKKALFVDDGADAAHIALQYGKDWLGMNTTAVLDGEKLLSVTLDGYANCDGGVMAEIWQIAPAESVYRYDEVAQKELAEDLELAQSWRRSVRLLEAGLTLTPTQQEELPVADSLKEYFANIKVGAGQADTQPNATLLRYTDTQGKLGLDFPKNCIVVSVERLTEKKSTAEADVPDEAYRQLYLRWLDEMEKGGDVLFIAPDFSYAMLLTVNPEAAISLADMAYLVPAVTTALGQEMEDLKADGVITSVPAGQHRYWGTRYQGRQAGAMQHLFLLLEENTPAIHEINIWFVDGAVSQEWLDAFIAMVESTTYDIK